MTSDDLDLRGVLFNWLRSMLNIFHLIIRNTARSVQMRFFALLSRGSGCQNTFQYSCRQ